VESLNFFPERISRSWKAYGKYFGKNNIGVWLPPEKEPGNRFFA
jgi:hypothetical protein